MIAGMERVQRIARVGQFRELLLGQWALNHAWRLVYVHLIVEDG